MWRLAPVALVVVTVAVAAPSEASWQVTGTTSGNSNGKAAVLNAPTVAKPICTNGIGTNNGKVKIELSWTDPVAGVTPASYTVTMDSSSSANQVSPFSTGFFVPSKNHTYSIGVSSVTGGWSTTSAARTVSIPSSGNCGAIT